MRSDTQTRLMENENGSLYGSFSRNDNKTTNWTLNTPTKALIEHDFCTNHEHILATELDTHDAKKFVVRFDEEGNMEYLEMSRMDVLKIVQELNQRQTKIDAMQERNHKLEHRHSLSTSPSIRCGISPPQRLRKRSSVGVLTGSCGAEVQQLHMRDLRQLEDTYHATNSPSITIRRQVILVHADPLRCVVTRNSLIVFVPTGADRLIQLLRDKIYQCCTEEAHIDFEFRALETIFYALCKLLSSDCEKLVDTVTEVLRKLSSASLSSGELEILTILKNKVHEFESQILDTRRVLMELLDNDQDLRLLYLTKLFHNPTPVKDLMGLDVEEAEGIIEAYLLDIHSMRTKVGLIQTRMINTENIVMLKLDSVRNALLSIDTIFGLVMLAMNFAMFVSSAFGMNLVSGYETQPNLFWGVFICSTTFAVALTYIGIRYFRSKGVILL